MSCISASVTPIIGAIAVNVGGGIMMDVEINAIAPTLSASTSAKPTLSATATALPTSLDVSTTMICTPADLHYVFVNPTETQWISEYDIAIYMVESDTKWYVE
jgi:hypothetical protein